MPLGAALLPPPLVPVAAGDGLQGCSHFQVPAFDLLVLPPWLLLSVPAAWLDLGQTISCAMLRCAMLHCACKLHQKAQILLCSEMHCGALIPVGWPQSQMVLALVQPSLNCLPCSRVFMAALPGAERLLWQPGFCGAGMRGCTGAGLGAGTARCPCCQPAAPPPGAHTLGRIWAVGAGWVPRVMRGSASLSTGCSSRVDEQRAFSRQQRPWAAETKCLLRLFPALSE